MNPKVQQPIAIVGGGIAGLATAAALNDAGVRVEVFEQARALGEVGAGIALTPNSLRVLDGLGLSADIDATSVADRRGMVIYAPDGSLIAEPAPMRGDGARLIHRADLLDALRSRLDPEMVKLSSRVSDVAPGDDDVVLSFEGGGTRSFAAAIGADGIHSVVRPVVVAESPPVFSGMIAYRGLVPAERLPEWSTTEASLYAGPGKHFLVFPVRGGTLLNFVAFVLADDETRESWSAPGEPAALAAEFAGWNDKITAFVAAVERTFRWGLYDREPLATWIRGRVALAGDAAHAMLPHAGQGANQSIEDAGALAAVLRDRPAAEYPAALVEYDAARRERASFVQRYARRLGLEYDGRFGELRPESELAPKPMVSEWLMRHDARAAAAAVRAGHEVERLPVGAPV